MKPVQLITNLGNRNLLFDGQDFNTYKRLHLIDDTFRSFTQKLANQDYPKQVEVRLNIIPSFLALSSSFEKIILVCTDGEGSQQAKIDQDTCYEAVLVKQMLSEHFGIASENIFIWTYYHDPTDHEALTEFYLRQLIIQKERNPNSEFYLSDSGGTPQQKASMKLAAEFLFNQGEFRAFYLKIHETVPQELPRYAFRKILLREQVIRMAKQGQFLAASQVWPGSGMKDDKAIRLAITVCETAHLRKELFLQDAQNKGKTLRSKDAILTAITTADNPNIQVFLSCFNQQVEPSVEAAERLTAALFDLENKNLSGFCLSFSVFTESFIQLFISSLTFEKEDGTSVQFDLKRRYEEDAPLFKEWIDNHYPEIENRLSLIFGQPTRSISLPHYLLFLDAYSTATWADDHPVKFLAKLFISLNSILNNNPAKTLGLDRLRNVMAHRGTGVEKKELEAVFRTAGFSSDGLKQQLFEKFNLQNPYLAYAAEIERLLRR